MIFEKSVKVEVGCDLVTGRVVVCDPIETLLKIFFLFVMVKALLFI